MIQGVAAYLKPTCKNREIIHKASVNGPTGL